MERVTPDFSRSNALQNELHRLVPGGAHTYARGADQYPEFMCPIISHGSGARVWDVDGNEFVEYGAGLRSVTLGHGYEPVVAAVTDAISRGTSFTRPTELELRAAEDFLSLVPGAEMVKFAKNGSDTTTAAVRLARAVTGRQKIAVCRQPFFSVDDWFIGTTQMNAGIPDDVKAASVLFDYNDPADLAAVFGAQPNAIAAVIMEAATTLHEPTFEYLQRVRSLCDEYGALLIFDEMITGFRWSVHGAQALYGVVPDLSCWGKAMGNGFAVSALAGRREFMERGGLTTDEERVFLLSTTHGAETTGLAAFRAVVRAYRDLDPVSIMESRGRRLRDGINAIAVALGIGDFFEVAGRPSCLLFITRDAEGRPSQAFRALFLQEMLRRGILGQSFVVSAAHTEDEIDTTIEASQHALRTYAMALEAGSVRRFIEGRPVAPAIRRHAAPRRVRLLQC